jgi:Ni/Co efflux regulator RcnB
MEHAAPVNGAPAHYARDSRGYGTRPSNWNNRPRNFDRASYQRNVTAGARFHYGSYQRPSGWYYRRWTYGETLPAIFWAQNYWLTSWWMFDLAIPPYGYEWVRYGDDALLINVYNGQILQVDYGVFY